MAAPPGSVLPPSYFEGLSELWGACAYVGSALAAAGFVFAAARRTRGPGSLIELTVRLFIVGLTTLFLREWLMRLNDVVNAFGDYIGIDPEKVDERFVAFISGTSPMNKGASVWDVIWDTGSIGTAVSYAMLWMFGWLSWGVQYIVKLVGDILLSAGWSLSPIFIAFFMIRPMAGVGLKYLMGLVALVCWPFGWVIAAVVTNAMLEAAAGASLMPMVIVGTMPAVPALTVLLVGTWMIVSSVLAPFITTKVLMMGANPAAAFAQSAGGVAQAALTGGFVAGGAALTGGAAAAGVIAASAAGAMASAGESAARGGGAPRTATTVAAGLAGFYGAGSGRRQSAAMDGMAASFSRFASAAESMASSSAEQGEFFRQARNRMNRQGRERAAQPHTENPNEVALEIEAHARN